MSFFGLINIRHPYCPHCETSVHLDYIFNETRMIGDDPDESIEYKCIKCGTEMIIESYGDSWYSIYPDEDTMPEDDHWLC
jgi:hypothetical protein